MTGQVVLMAALLLYGAMMVWLAAGLRNGIRHSNRPVAGNLQQPVSVVIPCRNEPMSLSPLLKHLSEQLEEFPGSEILIADDHSEPPVSLPVDLPARGIPVRLIRLAEGEPEGKKAAITAAVHKAANALILVIDADCIPGRQWVKSMVQPFSRTGCRMTGGMVKLDTPGRGFTAAAEMLDFYGLAGAAAGAAVQGKPFMCHGATMAFLKDAFQETGGYASNAEISSGDDVFLMHTIMRKYGAGSFVWNFSPGGEVLTSPAGSFRSIIRQRLRWASKSRHYTHPMAIMVAVTVLAANLALVAGTVAAFAGNGILPVLAAFSLKSLADLPVLLSMTSFFGQRFPVWWYLPVSVWYPFYTTFTGVLSFFVKTRWKGRTVKN
ncbi:MAG TPA: glycosyltransferase [Bacteroidales bacterium]|nr:glycosyltransferase [Bacteroidales bacterium]HRZ48791.1 glycosyltransferase [Bacteroidales bacterium]